MACNCIPRVVPTTPTSCTDCIIAKSLRFGCDDAPDPCGETVVLDLSDYNVTSACKNCSVQYQIKSYDPKGFSSVSITSGGTLTYTTSDDFEKGKEYIIEYKVICPCSTPILSSTGKVYVCKKDLCKTAPSKAACDNCTGIYVKANDSIITAVNSALSKCAGTVSYNLSTLVQENASVPITYSLISATSGLTSVTINTNTGLLSASKLGEGYEPQKIVWSATDGTVTSFATLTIEIKNLCANVLCAEGYVCDECEGECVSADVDLEITA